MVMLRTNRYISYAENVYLDRSASSPLQARQPQRCQSLSSPDHQTLGTGAAWPPGMPYAPPCDLWVCGTLSAWIGPHLSTPRAAPACFEAAIACRKKIKYITFANESIKQWIPLPNNSLTLWHNSPSIALSNSILFSTRGRVMGDKSINP